MQRLHIFQILNHYTSAQDLDPGFTVLDNSANERPDWYEYWPIRQYLTATRLDDDAYYGFLSPKFKHKTGLSAAAVSGFIERAQPSTDVALFSPSIHKSAYYLSVFEHGDAEHPGLLRTASQFFERIGRPIKLEDVISDSRNTVHSNYFIAKPRFWRAWLAVTEQLFAIAEMPNDPLGAQLCAPTKYRSRTDVQMKIFVMERIATLILVTDMTFSVAVRDPFVARSRHYKLPLAIICDALKIAYTTQHRSQYRDVFLMVRALSRYWTWQIKMGGIAGLPTVRRHLRSLRSHWNSIER